MAVFLSITCCKQRLTFEHIAVFLIEFVYTTSRVNNFLFTGIEWMTCRTYFNTESIFLHCGFSYKGITARAGHGYVVVVWLNAVIHSIVLGWRVQGLCLYLLKRMFAIG
jgi:hypothetical protein